MVRPFDYYYQHATAVTIIDDAAHGRSLWNAAICYDKDLQWNKAIEVLAKFRATHPSDPRQLEATKQLALAYQALGQYQTAIDLFLQLIKDEPVSRHAIASNVPLARCHIAMGNLNAALTILKQIITNHDSITSESSEYRNALIEMGKLHYRMGDWEEAIAQLETTVQRYGHSGQGAVLQSYSGRRVSPVGSTTGTELHRIDDNLSTDRTAQGVYATDRTGTTGLHRSDQRPGITRPYIAFATGAAARPQ